MDGGGQEAAGKAADGTELGFESWPCPSVNPWLRAGNALPVRGTEFLCKKDTI